MESKLPERLLPCHEEIFDFELYFFANRSGGVTF